MSVHPSLDRIHIDRCVEVTGDARLGLALYRLVRWQSKTNIYKHGRRWVAWPRTRWMKVLRLTENQFRLVLEKLTRGEAPLWLRRQGLRNGRNVLHVALTDECVLQLINEPKPLTGVSGQARPGVSGQALTLYKNTLKETHIEEEKIASGFAVATLGIEKELKKTPEEEEKDTNVIPFPDVQDGSSVAESKPAIETKIAAAATATIHMPHSDSVAILAPIWTTATGEYVTQKLRGQLKCLVKKLAPGTAQELVKFALHDWNRLTYAAEKHHGAFKCPDKPAIGFLLRFAHVAVDCKKKADKLSPEQQKADNYLQKIAPTKPSLAELHGTPATLADLLEIEAELQAVSSGPVSIVDTLSTSVQSIAPTSQS